MLERHAEICVHRVDRQMCGELILFFNLISRDGVYGLGQMQPYFISSLYIIFNEKTYLTCTYEKKYTK